MASGVGDTGAVGTPQEQQLHTPLPPPPGSGSFRHGTGSAGEQRPEQPLLSYEERADLVDIAQDSPLASQRLDARRALLDDATLREQQMESAQSPGMRVLQQRARREREMAQLNLNNERGATTTPSPSSHSQESSPTPTPWRLRGLYRSNAEWF